MVVPTLAALDTPWWRAGAGGRQGQGAAPPHRVQAPPAIQEAPLCMAGVAGGGLRTPGWSPTHWPPGGGRSTARPDREAGRRVGRTLGGTSRLLVLANIQAWEAGGGLD